VICIGPFFSTDCFQRLARDERHRIVDEIFVLAGREERDDVRVLKLRGNLDLATEPAAVYICDQLW
jgi:hypothetical protein